MINIDPLLLAVAALLFLAASLGIYAGIECRTSITEFKEVCAQAGGVTVYNGRHYECVIKAVR